MSHTARLRIIYAVLSAVLLGTEIFIGVFVHDGFVRPHLGDVLVVMLLYTLVRIIIPEGARWLCGAVFVFAAGVECLQALRIADILGITHPVLRAIIGTSFDPGDILCYAAGCLLIAFYEVIIYLAAKKKRSQQ